MLCTSDCAARRALFMLADPSPVLFFTSNFYASIRSLHRSHEVNGLGLELELPALARLARWQSVVARAVHARSELFDTACAMPLATGNWQRF